MNFLLNLSQFLGEIIDINIRDQKQELISAKTDNLIILTNMAANDIYYCFQCFISCSMTIRLPSAP